MLKPTFLSLVCSFALVACGGGEPKTADDTSSDTAGTNDKDMEADPQGTTGGDQGASDGAAKGGDAGTTGGDATGGDAKGGDAKGGDAKGGAASETAKEPNALVLNLTFSSKGGGKVDDKTAAELTKAANERMSTSAKLASPSSKVDKPRAVNVTVMIEKPTDDKTKGLTIKMGLVGVEPNGKCPLFDLNQNFSMTNTTTKNDADVLALQRSAIQALLGKLEETASTLKPQANCSSFKKGT